MNFDHIDRRLAEGLATVAPTAKAEARRASRRGPAPPPDMARASRAVSELLDALGVPVDQHTKDTPRRVAKMLATEIFSGLYEPPPQATAFEAPNLDQVYAVGPATIRSACAHHLVPIIGQAWFGIMPGRKVIGLSKFSRLAHWAMARPTVQEEATEHLADLLWDATEPQGLAVVVRARHFCCAWRGIRDDGQLMVSSVVRGRFREDPAMRQELMTLLASLGATGA
jgi:GTP cyclohydrolase IA